MGHMNKGRAMFALWVIGTIVTGSLAWTAVAVAGSGGSPEVVRPLTAAEVGALASANTGSPTEPTDVSGVGASSADGAFIQAAAELVTTAFHFDAGSVGVQRADDQVRFAWATPNAGYHAEVEAYGPQAVIVEFEAEESDLSVIIRVVDGELVGQVGDADFVVPSTTLVDVTRAGTQPADPSPSTTNPTNPTTTRATTPDDDEHSEDDESDHDDSGSPDEDGDGGDESGGGDADEPDDDHEDDVSEDDDPEDDEKSDED
jgi:hypothetical protein